jgi:hypothetical protein
VFLLITLLYTGTINQYNYKETLERCLKPSISKLYGRSRNFLFQQDGASCHAANSMKDYFDKKHIRLLPWCARSPDLSPIENIMELDGPENVGCKNNKQGALKTGPNKHLAVGSKRIMHETCGVYAET